MSDVRIHLADDQAGFRPGETVSGGVEWSLDAPPDSAELRLLWHTRGKGDDDVQVVTRQTIDQPLQKDRRDFSFALPEGPYSFSGKLISLMWVIELILPPVEPLTREIVLSPTGSEIVLSAVEETK